MRITAPAKPVMTWQATAIKRFSFSWQDVDGETEYRLLENADGSSNFSLAATISSDSTSYNLNVSLANRINAKYKLQACNSGSCTDSDEVAVSGNLAEAIGYFKASNTASYDYFGKSLALSEDGETLVIGAEQEDSNANTINGDDTNDSATDSGAVYVFVNRSGLWSQQAYLKPHNTGINDNFGYSVDISDDGNTIIVGAYRESSDATGVNGPDNDNATESGAAYIFVNDGSNWSQQAYLKASNTQASDYFGATVVISGDGNTVAVGAYGEDGDGTGAYNTLPHGAENNNSAADFAGAVYVFTRSGVNWSQQAYLKASNTDMGDEFGRALDLSQSGDYLVVGAWEEAGGIDGVNAISTDNTKPGAGAAYIYLRTGTNWAFTDYLKPSNTGGSDNFGRSVSISSTGDTVSVSAIFEDSSATGINGSQAAGAIGSGAAYIFTRTNTLWNQSAYIKASNTNASDYFGASLKLSGTGNQLIVGAYREAGNGIGMNPDQSDNSATYAGAAYFYERNLGTWKQKSYLKSKNTGIEDRFGYSVNISTDGGTIMIGAYPEESNATGINEDDADNSLNDSGAVYLY